eukprot:1231816-Prorocentrum_lima.AAC.1
MYLIQFFLGSDDETMEFQRTSPDHRREPCSGWPGSLLWELSSWLPPPELAPTPVPPPAP